MSIEVGSAEAEEYRDPLVEDFMGICGYTESEAIIAAAAVRDEEDKDRL
jgi:hypothetical protein